MGERAPTSIAFTDVLSAKSQDHSRDDPVTRLPIVTLETLPSVVLDLVCDFLRIDQFDDCRSLHSFALASRTCRLASESSRFHRLFVSIHDLSDVAQAVRDATAMLTGRMHHVRELWAAQKWLCPDPHVELGMRCDHSTLFDTLVGNSKQQRHNFNSRRSGRLDLSTASLDLSDMAVANTTSPGFSPSIDTTRPKLSTLYKT